MNVQGTSLLIFEKATRSQLSVMLNCRPSGTIPPELLSKSTPDREFTRICRQIFTKPQVTALACYILGISDGFKACALSMPPDRVVAWIEDYKNRMYAELSVLQIIKIDWLDTLEQIFEKNEIISFTYDLKAFDLKRESISALIDFFEFLDEYSTSGQNLDKAKEYLNLIRKNILTLREQVDIVPYYKRKTAKLLEIVTYLQIILNDVERLFPLLLQPCIYRELNLDALSVFQPKVSRQLHHQFNFVRSMVTFCREKFNNKKVSKNIHKKLKPFNSATEDFLQLLKKFEDGLTTLYHPYILIIKKFTSGSSDLTQFKECLDQLEGSLGEKSLILYKSFHEKANPLIVEIDKLILLLPDEISFTFARLFNICFRKSVNAYVKIYSSLIEMLKKDVKTAEEVEKKADAIINPSWKTLNSRWVSKFELVFFTFFIKFQEDFKNNDDSLRTILNQLFVVAGFCYQQIDLSQKSKVENLKRAVLLQTEWGNRSFYLNFLDFLASLCDSTFAYRKVKEPSGKNDQINSDLEQFLEEGMIILKRNIDIETLQSFSLASILTPGDTDFNKAVHTIITFTQSGLKGTTFQEKLYGFLDDCLKIEELTSVLKEDAGLDVKDEFRINVLHWLKFLIQARIYCELVEEPEISVHVVRNPKVYSSTVKKISTTNIPSSTIESRKVVEVLSQPERSSREWTPELMMGFLRKLKESPYKAVKPTENDVKLELAYKKTTEILLYAFKRLMRQYFSPLTSPKQIVLNSAIILEQLGSLKLINKGQFERYLSEEGERALHAHGLKPLLDLPWNNYERKIIEDLQNVVHKQARDESFDWNSLPEDLVLRIVQMSQKVLEPIEDGSIIKEERVHDEMAVKIPPILDNDIQRLEKLIVAARKYYRRAVAERFHDDFYKDRELKTVCFRSLKNLKALVLSLKGLDDYDDCLLAHAAILEKAMLFFLSLNKKEMLLTKIKGHPLFHLHDLEALMQEIVKCDLVINLSDKIISDMGQLIKSEYRYPPKEDRDYLKKNPADYVQNECAQIRKCVEYLIDVSDFS